MRDIIEANPYPGQAWGIPYGIAVGNHDQFPSADPGTLADEGSTTTAFNSWFGVSRYTGRGYYAGHYGTNNDNHYELFSAGGMDFIALHIEYPAFNGLIGEVEIFNRALTTDDIAAIYYAGSAGKCRSCVNTPSNMISWWNGEGDANDSIGTNHGAVTNGATFSPGKIGQTFSFDGVDDYITIPHNADLNPSAITVDAWIKTPAGPERVVVEKSHDNTGGWVMEVQPDGRASFGYFNGDASWTTNSVFSIGTVHDNNWHHVAATLEGSAIKIYIDGALDNSAVYSGSPVTNTRDVNIGKWHGGSRFFNGLIDEVGIFSRALTASEIAGDLIEIDLPARTINLCLPAEEIQSRLAALPPFETQATSRWLRRYTHFVTSADTGAVLKY